MKQYLEIGEIVSTHGVTGEMKVYPWVNDPRELTSVHEVFLDESATRRLEVLSSRVHKNMWLVRLEGITSIEMAHQLIKQTLWAHRSQINIEKDKYFVVDIIGLSVIHDETKEQLGVVTDVTTSTVQDLYHVRIPSGDIRLIPVVPEFVKKVDLEAGVVEIHPIEGLLSDEH